MMNQSARASGVLLHLTSLPGPHGAGDLGPDAYYFVDWLVSCGQTLWQWLPTTPIGPGHSPYQSVSAFAGSPSLVALEPLVQKSWLDQPSLPVQGFDWQRANYDQVVPWRMQQLRKAYAGFIERGNQEDRQSFAAWCESQSHWLADYALFMALEEAHDGKFWWQWPKPLQKRQASALEPARIEHQAAIGFWNFVQWSFEVQANALKSYANAKGVSIVGDLPIFVAHHSADCWANPELFYLDANLQPSVVAGAPPDAMAALGQRWGNPLYRWNRMAKQDYAWWVARVRRLLKQVDMFRIDHFRGFAQYWEIPASSPDASQGRWRNGPGLSLFKALEKSLGKLPVIAEDLGVITPDVTKLRLDCGFPGMKILQFAFAEGADHDYLPHQYSKDFVVYTGTHDNDTSQGWWHAASERERAFAGSYLASGGVDIHWAMIRAASNSVADAVIFPLQDVLGLATEHRMNVPGSAQGHWAWRFDWSMVGAEPGRVLGLISAASGRAAHAMLRLPS